VRSYLFVYLFMSGTRNAIRAGGIDISGNPFDDDLRTILA